MSERAVVPGTQEQAVVAPAPRIMEDAVAGVQTDSVVPQTMEEIVERVQSLVSLVPQITEEILDSVQLVDVGTVVPLITEDSVDVVQVMPQERVQNRTLQQIVGEPVRDKIAISEKIVEKTQPVLSKRKQERETLREHTWGTDFGDVPVPSRQDHADDALIPNVTELVEDVWDIPLQRIWCMFEEDGSASVEQIVDVLVSQDMETLGVGRRKKSCVGGTMRVVWQHSPG